MWEKHALTEGQTGRKDFERENEGQNRKDSTFSAHGLAVSKGRITIILQ